MAYDPALLSQVLGLGGIDQRQAALQRQMQTAQALRQGSGRRATTPLGAILSGVADAGGAIGGSVIEERAARQMAELGKQRETGRQAFLSGVTQADQTGRQQEAGALLSSRPFVPFADDYNAQSLTMRDTAAQAGAQQRQQDARSLAVLSGDPVLKQWAAMQAPAGGGDGLAEQRLDLSRQRLGLAQDAEARKASALEKTLGFKEQQARDQKAAADARAAAKRVADAQDKEEGLRKEYTGNTAYKQAQAAVAGLRQIEAAQNNGIGDIQRIFAFVNLIDPGSVVRDSDVATLGRAGGLPGQAQAMFNQLTAQGSLSEDVRRQIVESARSIKQARIGSADAVKETLRGIATQYGINPDRVFIPLESAASSRAVSVPPAGPGTGNWFPEPSGTGGTTARVGTGTANPANLPPQNPSDLVNVRKPDGTVVPVERKNLPRALELGGIEVK